MTTVSGPSPVATGVTLLTLGTGAAASNVYFVESPSRWVLVDTGWASSAEPIRSAAAELFGHGVGPAAILLTHVHPDHSGAAGALARGWGVPAYAHPAEIPAAAGRYLPQFSMPLDRWLVVPLMRLLPAGTRRRIEAAGNITDVVRPLPGGGAVPELPQWEWVATRGHTPGHVAYLRRDDGVLISGDAALTVNLNSVRGLLFGRPQLAGPPRYTTWNWAAALASIGVLGDVNPSVLAPGHGQPVHRPVAGELRALAGRRGVWGGLQPRYVGTEPYRAPPRWYARMQGLGHALTTMGLSPEYVVTLEVPGRRSGHIRRTSLVQVEHDGARYLVALAGESEWVRNVRAAEGRVVLTRRRRRPAVTLVEVPPERRAPVIQAYLLRQGRHPRADNVVREARNIFGVDRPDLTEIAAVATRYPVFQVVPGPPGSLTTVADEPAPGVIENTVDVAAPAQVLFDYVTELNHEPQWNPQMRHVEQLTDGPIGVGTKYRVVFGRGVGPALIENTAFERPRSWAAVSRSRVLTVRSQGTITSTTHGSRLRLRTDLSPHGPLALLTPVLRQVLQRALDDDLARMRRIVESGPPSEGLPPGRSITRVPVPDLCSLWAEGETSPMHLALAAVFDGAPLTDGDGTVRIHAVRAAVADRLHRAPMLRRVLLDPGPGQGRAIWADAADFRVGEHVTLVSPPHGIPDLDAYWTWCAARSLAPLDRRRPLWRLDVVPGLPEDQVGVLLVLHHVVADGLRAIEMIGGLLDTAPHPAPSAVPPWRPQPTPHAAALVQDNVVAKVTALQGLRPQTAMRGWRAVRSVVREHAHKAPRTVLNGPIGPDRHVAVLQLPLERVRAIAHSRSCTINDLVLAGVTEALRGMLGARNECPDGSVLRVSAPVGRPGQPGGMIVVPLPVGTADRSARLHAIVAETTRRKQHPDEGITGIVSMPATLARIGVMWARRTAASHINLYVTNVPGPATPLYLSGARLQAVLPFAPLVAGVRLSVTVLSYAGALTVTVLADNNVGDVRDLAAAAESAVLAYTEMPRPDHVPRPSSFAPPGAV